MCTVEGSPGPGLGNIDLWDVLNQQNRHMEKSRKLSIKNLSHDENVTV